MSKEQFLSKYGDVDHAIKGIKSSDENTRYFAAQNHLLPHIQMKNIMLTGDWDDTHGLAKNPALPTELADNLTTHEDHVTANAAQKNNNISPAKVDDIVRRNISSNRDTISHIIQHSPHITKEHLRFILKSKSGHSNDNQDLAEIRLMKDHGVDQ